MVAGVGAYVAEVDRDVEARGQRLLQLDRVVKSDQCQPTVSVQVRASCHKCDVQVWIEGEQGLEQRHDSHDLVCRLRGDVLNDQNPNVGGA